MSEKRNITLSEALHIISHSNDEQAKILECSDDVLRNKINGNDEWTATDVYIILKQSGLSFDQIAL